MSKTKADDSQQLMEKLLFLLGDKRLAVGLTVRFLVGVSWQTMLHYGYRSDLQTMSERRRFEVGRGSHRRASWSTDLSGRLQ